MAASKNFSPIAVNDEVRLEVDLTDFVTNIATGDRDPVAANGVVVTSVPSTGLTVSSTKVTDNIAGFTVLATVPGAYLLSFSITTQSQARYTARTVPLTVANAVAFKVKAS